MHVFTQMVRGVLEGCLLAIIDEEETYGYEIMEKLALSGFVFAKEGSIYPLLLRLEKENFVASTLHPSASGPNRKYYRLTLKGEQQLQLFRGNWNELSNAVNSIIKKEDGAKC
ncbi:MULTISPECIES: PadR family transcriptional regulator [Paenibacillus]|uniref:PadR family transcriptional regulator n=1 Tax=Paenibacillus TaxID=44249 RepID=UPI00096BDC32|nr:PadR family transcriptional regulator [Paenibacillus odorifer]MEC0135181.1 PadR family transcriptional regulator [Paenibacillus odorifer]MEC0225044.1 PadR family transcriptional regulator [Paenibacillus odorifer]OME49235.1 PadR family transcriptional regulator [Paenibacillus odorifer]